MSLELWTLAIASLTAVACALCGVFLVVKREALVSEGLSHAVLPGIIFAFVLLRDRNSPLLILSAALMGVVMVLLVQLIRRTRLVDDDASLGIVFATLFSIGILVSNLEIRNVHFHAHCVIDGNLALSPLDGLTVGGYSWGPKSFYVMLGVLMALLGFLSVCYKELKLMLFDETLAESFGFRPGLLHFIWLTLVSITTVAAFETAGSILVVALMITPPAAAYLLTHDLRHMLSLSCAIGVLSAVGGFFLALPLDIAPTGPMAFVSGVVFLVTLVLAPRQGLLARRWRTHRQRDAMYQHLFLAGVEQTCSWSDLQTRFCIEPRQLAAVRRRCEQQAFVQGADDSLRLTEAGVERLRAFER